MPILPAPPIGTQFKKLTVISEPFSAKPYGKTVRMVTCSCECGNSKNFPIGHLIHGKWGSCGCNRHGFSHTPLFYVWQGMKQRTTNPNHVGHHNYGGREITVCDEWQTYLPFHEWAMSHGYQEGLQIDRENNDGNYEPSNCRWVTHKINSRNMRKSVRVTAFGETKLIYDWLEDPRCVVTYLSLYHRIRRGMDAELAIITPMVRAAKHHLT